MKDLEIIERLDAVVDKCVRKTSHGQRSESAGADVSRCKFIGLAKSIVCRIRTNTRDVSPVAIACVIVLNKKRCAGDNQRMAALLLAAD
jgi:hypothetical protein